MSWLGSRLRSLPLAQTSASRSHLQQSAPRPHGHSATNAFATFNRSSALSKVTLGQPSQIKKITKRVNYGNERELQLKRLLQFRTYSTSVGDEGASPPNDKASANASQPPAAHTHPYPHHGREHYHQPHSSQNHHYHSHGHGDFHHAHAAPGTKDHTTIYSGPKSRSAPASSTHTTVHSHPSHHVSHTDAVPTTPAIDDPLIETAFFDEDSLTQFQVPFYQISMAGGVAAVSERKISKYELSYETGMPLRDLRPFTHQLNRKLQVAGLVTRPRSFLINCEPLQAIVLPDRLQIFNVEPEDQPYLTALLRKMQRPSQAAFEHRALECILSITVKRLEQEAGSFEERLSGVLNNATRNPNSQHLWDLREISDTIEAHGAYVGQALGAITGVLQKDDFMLMMYLSRNASGKSSHDHRDVELILEAAEDRLQALDHSCTMLQARITNAEQFLAVSNDTQRNEIIRLTLYATILSLGFASASVVGSTFGMNLISGLESNPDMFWSVVFGMSGLFLAVILEGAYMIRKIDSDRPRSKAGRSVKF